MDMLDFIPSKDVREYAKAKGYKPTTADAASIVYNSNKTLEEKHTAYREIINAMPDCIIKDSDMSIHNVLCKLIEAEDNVVKEIYEQENGALYGVNVTAYDFFMDEDYSVHTEGNIQSIQKCFDILSTVRANEMNTVFISKRVKGLKRFIFLNENMQITKAEAYYGNSRISDKAMNYLNLKNSIIKCKLDKNFPIPFDEGDIICYKDDYGEMQRGLFHKYKRADELLYGLLVYKQSDSYLGDDGKIVYKNIEARDLLNASYIKDKRKPRCYIILKLMSALMKYGISVEQFFVVE